MPSTPVAVNGRSHGEVEMISIEFTRAELEALYAVYAAAATVDWPAYDRARQRIVDAGRAHLGRAEPLALPESHQRPASTRGARSWSE
jgi:hypothetical protein